MAASVKAILRKDKKRADGTCPVSVRITANRRSRQIRTGVFVAERDWNPKRQHVRARHELADAYNSRIATVLNEARTEALKASSALDVVVALKKGSGAVVRDLDMFVDELDQRGQEWERRKYRVLRGKLVDCFDLGLTWERLDRRALLRFEEYLRVTRGNQSNTIRNEMKRLRRLFKRALVDRTVRADQDPFLGYQAPKQTEPNRRKLTAQEVELLERGELAWSSGPRSARDAFLFATYCAGIRFGDLSTLTADNLVDGRLEYQMSKTKQRVSLQIYGRSSALIDSYARAADPFLFPFLKPSDVRLDGPALKRRINSCLVTVNRNLRKAAIRVGVDPVGLSFHVARHTFAERARLRGVPIHDVGMTMRHNHTRETGGYVSRYDMATVDATLQQTWD